MKKVLSVILVLCMLFALCALSACQEKQEGTGAAPAEGAGSGTSGTEQTSPAQTQTGESQEPENEQPPADVDWTTWRGNGELVATIFPTVAPEALQQINDQWGGMMSEHGLNPQFASAELDPTQYIPLIENYVTMGAILLCISPMDPTGLEDIITRARAEGVYVTMLSAQPQYEIDGGLTTDNYATGVATAQLMLDFIEKTWPDAAPKSIPVAQAETTALQEYIQRTEGIRDTIEASEKAYVAYRQELQDNTADQGFNFAEAALTTDNTIRCFIMSDADQLTGVNNYIMALPDADFSQFCVVATGNLQPEVEALINVSANHEAVVRGIIAYGGATPGLSLGEVALKLLSGAEAAPCWIYDEIYSINSYGFEYAG